MKLLTTTPAILSVFLGMIINLNVYGQSWLWSKTLGGSDYDEAHAVAVDSLGHSYVTGSFTGTALFGDTELSAKGQADIYLAKYNAQGELLWVRQAGGKAHDEGKALSIGSDGSVYLTGIFSSHASFEDQLISTHGDVDVFLAKYDEQGELLQVINAMGSAHTDNVSGIASSGNAIYITGDYQAGASHNDIFITKFESQRLGLQWMQFAGGPESQQSLGIAADQEGNCYLTGTFGGTMYLGELALKASSSNDIFVAKYRHNGVKDWWQHIQIEGQIQNAGVSVDPAGRCYLMASFDYTANFGDIELTAAGEMEVLYARYGAKGSLQWAKSSGNKGYLDAAALDIDSDGNCYLTGNIQGSNAFGSLKLVSSSLNGSYVVKIDQQGQEVWGVVNDQSSTGYVSDIAVGPQGNCWIAGQKYGNSGIASSAILTSAQEFDGFLSQFSYEQTSCETQDLGLTASHITHDQIHVLWENGAANEYKYRFRKLPNGPWQGQEVTDAQEITLTNLEPSSQYVFHIQAFCNNQQQVGSASIQFTTAQAGSCAYHPQNIRAQEVTATSASLVWDTDYPADLTGFQFRIRKPDGSWSQGFIHDAQVELTGLEPASTYEFILNSLCTDNKSPTITLLFTTSPILADLKLDTDSRRNTLLITPSEPMLVRIYDSQESLKSEVYVQEYGMELNLSLFEKGSYLVKGIHPQGTITQSLVRE